MFFLRLAAVPHLSDEDPNKPETTGDERHEHVTNEAEAAVRAPLSLNENDRHFSSFQRG
jgi:hypothetical protein